MRLHRKARGSPRSYSSTWPVPPGADFADDRQDNVLGGDPPQLASTSRAVLGLALDQRLVDANLTSESNAVRQRANGRVSSMAVAHPMVVAGEREARLRP